MSSYTLGQVFGHLFLGHLGWSVWKKPVQTSEFWPPQIKPRMYFTIMWYLPYFVASKQQSWKKNTRDRFFFYPQESKTRGEIFLTVPLEIMQQLYIAPWPCWQLECWTHETLYIRGWVGRVGSDPLSAITGRVGSKIRRVVLGRVQLCGGHASFRDRVRVHVRPRVHVRDRVPLFVSMLNSEIAPTNIKINVKTTTPICCLENNQHIDVCNVNIWHIMFFKPYSN